MKDSSGRFVPLGNEFSVLTDTSDEEDEGNDDRGKKGKEGEHSDKYGTRDESTKKLIGKVPENAIPRTVAMPVQTPNGRDEQRSGKRSGKSSKTSNGTKKKVRIVV